jgi:hypothetical protein
MARSKRILLSFGIKLSECTLTLRAARELRNSLNTALLVETDETLYIRISPGSFVGKNRRDLWLCEKKYSCPHCWEEKGDHCRMPSGRIAELPHLQRYVLYGA